MEETLWYLLASSRGGPTRVEILTEVAEAEEELPTRIMDLDTKSR